MLIIIISITAFIMAMLMISQGGEGMFGPSVFFFAMTQNPDHHHHGVADHHHGDTDHHHQNDDNQGGEVCLGLDSVYFDTRPKI